MNQKDFRNRVVAWKNIIIEAVDLCEMPRSKKRILRCIPKDPRKIKEWPPSIETLDSWYRPDDDRLVKEAEAKKTTDILSYDVALKNLHKAIKEDFPTIESIKESLKLEWEYNKKRNPLNKRLREAYSRVTETTEKHHLDDVFYLLMGKHSFHKLDNIDTVLAYIQVKKSEYELDTQGHPTLKAFLNETLEERTKEYLGEHGDKFKGPGEDTGPGGEGKTVYTHIKQDTKEGSERVSKGVLTGEKGKHTFTRLPALAIAEYIRASNEGTEDPKDIEKRVIDTVPAWQKLKNKGQKPNVKYVKKAIRRGIKKATGRDVVPFNPIPFKILPPN